MGMDEISTDEYMSKEEIVETLKSMTFGKESFERFSSKERDAINKAICTIEKYQKMQTDYNARLKANMVAMLENLQIEFEEYEPKWAENEEQAVASNRTWDDFDDIIQQKIDKIKVESDASMSEQEKWIKGIE